MMLSGIKNQTRLDSLATREVLLRTYRRLEDAEAIVITLGYTEAWYDNVDSLYVNRSPAGSREAMRHKDRYSFHNFDSTQAIATLDKAVALLTERCKSDAKIVLTTSPVPLHTTFTDIDVIVANSYSKATLVSTACSIASRYENVDYFPSFELVSFSNTDFAFAQDGVHVTREVVSRVMSRFLEAYLSSDD